MTEVEKHVDVEFKSGSGIVCSVGRVDEVVFVEYVGLNVCCC